MSRLSLALPPLLAPTLPALAPLLSLVRCELSLLSVLVVDVFRVLSVFDVVVWLRTELSLRFDMSRLSEADAPLLAPTLPAPVPLLSVSVVVVLRVLSVFDVELSLFELAVELSLNELVERVSVD